MADVPDFASVIARLKEAGWTQTELAAECGITQQAIGSIALGATRDPHFRTGQRLLELVAGLDTPLPTSRAVTCSMLSDGWVLVEAGAISIRLSPDEYEALKLSLGVLRGSEPPEPDCVSSELRGPLPRSPGGAAYAELVSSAFKFMNQGQSPVDSHGARGKTAPGPTPARSSEQHGQPRIPSEIPAEPRFVVLLVAL